MEPAQFVALPLPEQVSHLRAHAVHIDQRNTEAGYIDLYIHNGFYIETVIDPRYLRITVARIVEEEAVLTHYPDQAAME